METEKNELDLLYGDTSPGSFHVGERLLQLRRVSGLSQRELAKRAGLTNSVISTIEQGKASPSVASLQKVLDGLGIDLAQFFSVRLSGETETLRPIGISQRQLVLPAGASSNLAISGFRGVALTVIRGSVLVREVDSEQVADVDQSLQLPPLSAYTLCNKGRTEAVVLVAELA